MQRRLAAGRRDAANPAFECGDAFFEHGVGRVRDARVHVAGALHIKERRGVIAVAKHERRREVDRRGARTGDRIGPLAGVQAERVELKAVRCGHGVLLDVEQFYQDVGA
jgi:hypothetical protein